MAELADAARQDGSSAPTWAWLVEASGVSRRTVARALCELVQAGFLVVVETGSTELTRPSHSPVEGNRAAVYGFRVPEVPRRGTGTPMRLREARRSGTPLRSSTYGGTQTPYSRTKRPPEPASGGGTWPSHQGARTGRERLLLARTLRTRAWALRRTSDRALRAALRPELEAGWSVQDVLWALDHEPDGRVRWHTQDVRCPVGWLRARLRPWAGLPGPISAARAAEGAARRAAQQQRREELVAAQAAAVPMPEYVREALRAAQAGRRGCP